VRVFLAIMSAAPPIDAPELDEPHLVEPDLVEDDDAIFAEVAQIDLALLRHVQAKALATDDPDTLNGLVRSCQRLSRSIRQTLAIKAKLKRDREQDAARAGPDPEDAAREAELERDRARREIRLGEVQDAGGRMLAAALPKERYTEAAERLDAYLDLADEAEDFGLRPLADDLADLAGHFDVPADIVARWERLPQAPWLVMDFSAFIAGARASLGRRDSG
jgi:hypothetical protein